MPRGGARNRSGPLADPNSGRSERRKYTLSALPREGRPGRAPAFPLPIRRFRIVVDGELVEDKKPTREFRDRELAVWREYWRTPQACAWESSQWMWETIGEFCRLKTVVELAPDSNAALVAQLHRYRDQIGLTPAGLRDNGWKIAEDPQGPLAVVADVPEGGARQHRRSREMSA